MIIVAAMILHIGDHYIGDHYIGENDDIGTDYAINHAGDDSHTIDVTGDDCTDISINDHGINGCIDDNDDAIDDAINDNISTDNGNIDYGVTGDQHY